VSIAWRLAFGRSVLHSSGRCLGRNEETCGATASENLIPCNRSWQRPGLAEGAPDDVAKVQASFERQLLEKVLQARVGNERVGR
jgi:hypothetical protein